MTHLDAQTLARFDELAFDERGAALEHLQTCARCRAAWLADDPSRLFALLGRAELPEEALDRLSQRVSAGLDRRRARTRLLGAASLAASLLLAALVGGYVYELPRPGSVEAPSTAPLTAGSAAPAAAGAPGSDEAAERKALPATLQDPVRAVELLESPGDGKLVNLTVGETHVVMIFDAELDI